MPGAFASGGRAAIFIDASNLWAIQKSVGKLLDLEQFVLAIQQRIGCDLTRVYYYTAYPAEGTRPGSTSAQHHFFTFLQRHLGFVVRKKMLKRIKTVIAGRVEIIEKGNMDVEIAIDAIHHLQEYDTAVLCTGDSDFLALVEYLKNRGKRVEVFSSMESISHELKENADGYHDIRKLSEAIWRKQIEPKP